MTVPGWLSGAGLDWSSAPEILESRRHDRSGWAPDGTPSAVVFARTAEDVVVLLRLADTTRTPVVPRGAGTALTGASTAGAGAIVLDLSRMNRILALNPDDGTAVVEPGVITADLDRAATQHGLRYAPDPASLELSTIGGNIATNAGGLRCAKYGVTRDCVLGLDVVLAGGRRISTGKSTLKGVSGYDLTSLIVGSEGTLAVVVGATVRLRPLPPPTATVAATFATVAEAADASVALTTARIQPVLAELLDAATLRAIDAAQGTTLSNRGGALLIVQTDAGPDATAEILARTATDVRTADAPAALLAARRQALPSIERLGRPLIEDIAVPRTRMAEAITEIEQIADRYGVPICTLAHAGDGNLHPIIVVPFATPASPNSAPLSPAASTSAQATTAPPSQSSAQAIPDEVSKAAADIFDLALRLGGTLTGEHGIGTLKRAWLGRELGPEQHALQQQIKAVFDPNNILNPGKAI